MHNSLQSAVNDLEKHGKLLRIKSEVDPNQEMAEIHRRIFDAGGPALLFEKVKGSPFRAASNLYGTYERTEFLFRKTLEKVRKVTELKADPTNFFRKPGRYLSAPFTALSALPRKARFRKPVMYGETTIDKLPQVVSWPMDGGAFVTLPQVMSLPPGSRKMMQSNIGMYRIQLSGNEYQLNKEIGLHYQLHRGIGVHHTAYNNSKEPFKVSIFVGGPPSHAFSAIMPLPEGLSEVTFAGMLAGRRFRYAFDNGFPISTDADFVITGTVRPSEKKPEGPFGDHLGYYSLEHPFPVMDVEKVYHRKEAIWHFTVVGRPPQEDSSFGYLIHQIVEALTPQEFPGLQDINAVDAAGVHPLLLAVGSERYMPFREKRPEEILTQANHLLGKGQTSLAKYLFIAAGNDLPNLDTHDIPAYFKHVLERIDLKRDLHFQTQTTIDTLDYSGSGWNAGSKLVVGCYGDKLRELSSSLPENLNLPDGFKNPVFWQAGVLVIESSSAEAIPKLAKSLEGYDWKGIPLIVVADDAAFTAQNTNNFVWVTFTRSNPSHDIYGVGSFVENKHWGCKGPLIIDARIKEHHAPPLIVNPEVVKKVDQLFSKGGELYGAI
ncbi:MAG: UbiD family decarboxylase [Bacteroidetes bacterium]|nr:UbiD family decarboxylase [Bacteroidota bacterium]